MTWINNPRIEGKSSYHAHTVLPYERELGKESFYGPDSLDVAEWAEHLDFWK